MSCSWLAVSKTRWCPAIQFESGECVSGNQGGNTSISSERAVEATRHDNLIFLLFASCTEMQVLTWVSRSYSILQSKLPSLSGGSTKRSALRDPSLNSVPQIRTRKRAGSAGHAQHKASFPHNNLHPIGFSKHYVQCSSWLWGCLTRMRAVANISLLH